MTIKTNNQEDSAGVEKGKLIFEFLHSTQDTSSSLQERERKKILVEVKLQFLPENEKSFNQDDVGSSMKENTKQTNARENTKQFGPCESARKVGPLMMKLVILHLYIVNITTHDEDLICTDHESKIPTHRISLPFMTR